MNIIDAMKNYMDKKNLSQAGLARELGMTRQNINAVVLGHRAPSKKMAEYFGFKVVKSKKFVKD